MKKLLLTIAASAFLIHLQAKNENTPELKLNGMTLNIAGQVFHLAPTKIKKRVETVTYKSGKNIIRQVAFMPVKLRATCLVDVKVKLASNGKILRKDKDFFIDVSGAISPMKPNVKPVKAIVEYTCFPERYDALFRMKNGKFVLKKGIERDYDASEHIPEMKDAERIVNINVRGNKAELAYSRIPEKVYAGKEYLNRFLSKLKKGQKIKVLGYGDSITAIELSKSSFTPGGIRRDRAEAYFYRFDKNTKAKLPLWRRNGINGHFVKAGWCWGLVNQLEKDYGVEVEWINAGIGGTKSKDGLVPERLKASLDLKPDIVVLGFGMNERGSKETYMNTVKLIKTFKKNSAQVIVVSVPNCRGMIPAYTNANLAKAASENKAAFVNLEKVEPGIVPRDYCSTNQYNHPGITELEMYRKALAV